MSQKKSAAHKNGFEVLVANYFMFYNCISFETLTLTLVGILGIGPSIELESEKVQNDIAKMCRRSFCLSSEHENTNMCPDVTITDVNTVARGGS